MYSDEDIAKMKAFFDKHTVQKGKHLIWTCKNGYMSFNGKIYKRKLALLAHGLLQDGMQPQQNTDICTESNCVHVDHIVQTCKTRPKRIRHHNWIPYEYDPLGKDIMCKPWGERRKGGHWL